MKVKFIKEHELGSNTFNVGSSYEIVNSLAELWIEEGFCELDNSVPLPKETEETEEVELDEDGEDVLDSLPDAAADLVKAIKTVTNVYALEELATDDRKTVKEAAEERLGQL